MGIGTPGGSLGSQSVRRGLPAIRSFRRQTKGSRGNGRTSPVRCLLQSEMQVRGKRVQGLAVGGR